MATKNKKSKKRLKLDKGTLGKIGGGVGTTPQPTAGALGSHPFGIMVVAVMPHDASSPWQPQPTAQPGPEPEPQMTHPRIVVAVER
jgi:hypothetical protein